MLGARLKESMREFGERSGETLEGERDGLLFLKKYPLVLERAIISLLYFGSEVVCWWLL